MNHSIVLKPVLAALLLVLLFAGCDRSSEYRADLDIESIADSITPILDHSGTMIRYDADQIHFFLGLPEPYCTDNVVMVQTKEGSVDEYGIFRCISDADAEALEELLDDYLELTIAGKLAYLNDCDAGVNTSDSEVTAESAQDADSMLTGRVRRYGIYVCYTLLDRDKDEELQNTLKSLLKK